MGRALRGCDNLRAYAASQSLDENTCRFTAVATQADVSERFWTSSSR